MPSASGNVTIQGYFDVHTSDGTAKQSCGKIDTQNAIAYLEAFRYAINRTNQNKNNVYKIGYAIRDTCRSSVTLKGIIRDDVMNQYHRAMFGIVGPGTSDAAMEISQVLNIWSFPAISYSAASSNFEQRTKHEYILRTIPDDSFQRQALLDIIRHFNWTYFSVVASCSSYDQQGLTRFIDAIRLDNRCLARVTTLPCIRSAASYEKEMKSILTDSKVRVLVMLTNQDDLLGLLTAAKKIGLTDGRLTWVAGTWWGDQELKRYGLDEVAKGALSLTYANYGSMADFKKHFFSLNPTNNNYSHFIEFWEEIFNCSTGSLKSSNKHIPCTGKEKLSDAKGWNPYTNVEPVFDAVYSLYRALVVKIPFCFLPTHLCPSHALLTASRFPNWLLQNPILDIYKTRNITFNSKGCVEGTFNVLNYAASSTGNKYKLVGSWRSNGIDPANGKLHMSDNLIQWPGSGSQSVPVSVCSFPCRTENGEISKPDANENLKVCCWSCTKCAIDEKIVNNTCVSCNYKQKPNAQRTACEALSEKTVEYSDPVGIAVVSCSVLGIAATTGVLLLFVKFYSSRIVKASSREACFFMLAGIYLCFVAPLIFLAEPSKVICGLQRFIAGLSFSTVYAPLFLKTNRIFRIFQSAKSTTARPSLISPVSQVLVSLGIVAVQLLLGIVWVIGDEPRVEMRYAENRQYAKLYCKLDPYTMALNLFICLVMMLACTWYAFRTRHFPKNYNETKSIMFTLYVSCFIWGVFVPTFLMAKNQDVFFRTYTLAIFCELVAFVSLIGFFFPKVRLLICSSQVNNDSDEHAMTTRIPVGEKHFLETKRIVVGGSGSFGENRTMQDNVSIGTSMTNLSDEKQKQSQVDTI